MKKLTCESCGSNIKLSKAQNGYVECDYCGASYKLDEDKNIDINLGDLSNIQSRQVAINSSKFYIIFSIIVFMIVAFNIIIMFTSSITLLNKVDDDVNFFDDNVVNSVNQYDKFQGIQKREIVINLIDIVDRMNKLSSNTITIEFNNVSYKSSDELNKLKSKITKDDYVITISSIDKIIIEEK